MLYVICFAILVLPVSAVLRGMILGLFDPIVPDNEGNLELTDEGTYELRIL